MALSLRRGVNLTHWLTRQNLRDRQNLDRYVNADDFAHIAGWGADHVRLLVDFEFLESESSHRLHPLGTEMLDRAIVWTRRAGLSLVIALRGAPGMEFNRPQECAIWTDIETQRRFASIWRRLAGRCHSPDCEHVAFDLLDRPPAPSAEAWGGLARMGLNAIRAVDESRVVLVGAMRHQPGLLQFAVLFANDPYILYAFSFFHPWIFTHQRWEGWESYQRLELIVDYPSRLPDLSAEAEKLAIADLKREVLQYSEAQLDADLLDAALLPARVFRRKENVPVYCAAYGVCSSAPRAACVRWLRDVRGLLARHDIGWAVWEYKGDFGLLNADGEEQPELVDAVFGGNA